MKNWLMKLFCGFIAVTACACLPCAGQDADGKPARNARRGEALQAPLNMIEERLEALKKENPAEFARLKKLLVEDREAFFKEFRKYLPPRAMFSPKIGSMERECLELSRQYKQARTEGEREAIKKELTEAVTKVTDALISETKEQIKKMENHLKEMENNRDTIIQKRLANLLDKSRKRPAGDVRMDGMPPRQNFDGRPPRPGDGERPDGDRMRGERPDGERPDGDRMRGDRPRGDRPGDAPEEDVE